MQAPTRIEVGSTVSVWWEDGRIDRHQAARLRAACPCAACHGAAVPAAGTAVTAARPVGAYAVAFTFAPDGHGTGIYSFDLLRALGER